MAAFTTLALLGLGLAGGMAAKSIADKASADGTGDASKSPHAQLGDAQTAAPPLAPPSLALTSGQAALNASAAAARQRKKAGPGADLLNGPTLSQPAAKSAGSPATLLGY